MSIDVTVTIGGEAGQGIQTVGDIIARVCHKAGLYLLGDSSLKSSLKRGASSSVTGRIKTFLPSSVFSWNSYSSGYGLMTRCMGEGFDVSSSRIRASTARGSPSLTITGFISSSAIWGKSTISCDTRISIASSASTSAGGRLRNPFKSVNARVSSIMRLASRRFSGGSPSARSFVI